MQAFTGTFEPELGATIASAAAVSEGCCGGPARERALRRLDDPCLAEGVSPDIDDSNEICADGLTEYVASSRVPTTVIRVRPQEDEMA